MNISDYCREGNTDFQMSVSGLQESNAHGRLNNIGHIKDSGFPTAVSAKCSPRPES